MTRASLDTMIDGWLKRAPIPALPGVDEDLRAPLVGPLKIQIGDGTNIELVSLSAVASGNQVNVERLRAAGLHLDHEPFKAPVEPQLDGDELRALLAERDYERSPRGILCAGAWIAAFKAQQAYQKLGVPVLVTDIGMAPRCFPQIFAITKSVLADDPSGLSRDFKANVCRFAQVSGDARVVATASAAISTGKGTKTWSIAVSGLLAPEPSGDGYGFDDMIIPEPEKQALLPRAAGIRGPQTWSQLDDRTRETHFPFRRLLVDEIRKSVVRG